MSVDPPRALRALALLTGAAALGIGACQAAGDDDHGEEGSEVVTALGGATTVDEAGGDAFTTIAANASAEERNRAAAGFVIFEYRWNPATGRLDDRDGLGPTFNARSCQSCHEENGRAAGPSPSEDVPPGLLVRLAVPDGVDERYGRQLQTDTVAGVPAEARIEVAWDDLAGVDGTPLRRPAFAASELAFGPLEPGSALMPRLAPALAGVGLLEAIPTADVLAGADPDDADGDGISGRPHLVGGDDGTPVPGRFGWKATQPSVEAQIADALWEDMGITSSHYPAENCPVVQTVCASTVHGGTPEIDVEAFEDMAHYLRLLGVPAARAGDGAVAAGATHFRTLGCARCHTPEWRTGDAASPALADQTIRPHTDLLLHDLGDGLADPAPSGDVAAAEWRTAPLWGIGLAEAVNDRVTYLHDGRARTLEEAVLWHGGEAEATRDAFVALAPDQRDELLAYLRSL